MPKLFTDVITKYFIKPLVRAYTFNSSALFRIIKCSSVVCMGGGLAQLVTPFVTSTKLINAKPG